jgi:major membrane immunogen (membrane-anchored lipoprotein)
MKKTLLILVAIVFVATACENNTYTDGTYAATYDAIDSHDWRAFVEITISDDMITVADFDYWDATADTLKSEHPGYNATMLAIKGTNPETFCPLIEAAIKDAVIVPAFDSINSVAGATHSSHNASELVAAALESALDAGGDVVIAQPDPAE